MATDRIPAEDTQARRIPVRPIVAGSIGHALEVYDYVVYGLVATAVGAAFLPSHDPGVALVQTFIAFGAGFAIRPLGGLILGHLGDTWGRRNTLVVVVGVGALSTIAVGVLPTYAAIGFAAPVLLFLARLTQGFAGGGEAASSFPFIVEYAPGRRRGLVGSFQQIGTLSGHLIATGAVLFVSLSMPDTAYQSWGWRLPFLFAVVVGAFAVYLRLGISDSPEFVRVKENRATVSLPIKDAFRRSWRAMLVMSGLSLFVNVGYLAIQVFNVNYVVQATDLPLRLGLVANAITLGAMILTLPFWGALSDRLGRKPVMLGSIVAFTLVSYPAYALMAQGTFGSYLAGQVIQGVTITAFSGTFISTVVELFPLTVRASALAISYNVSGIVAIGFTPAIMAWLSNRFNYAPVGPFLWIVVGAIFGLVSVLAMRETAHRPLRSD